MAKTRKKKSKKAVKQNVLPRRGPKPGSVRVRYKDSLKKRVVKAVRKGMTHAEASVAFDVGIHSIPNWLHIF